jgi:hypothetical protein
VPDEPICVELSLDEGYCIYTLSDREFKINETHKHSFNGSKSKTWWELRPTMLHLPAESWAEIKKFIINICKDTKKCSEYVHSWDRTIEKIDKMTKE